MYLVFDLPPAGGYITPSAHTIAYWLHREIDAWYTRHGIEYRTKFHKTKLRLIFSTEQEYNFFMMSWAPNFDFRGYKIEEKWAKFTVANPPKY
jgi:hypothetical protein